MKNRRNRFLPPAVDPGAVESRFPLAEKLAGHLRWAAAISGALRRGNGLPRWRPATFIFGLRARRILSLVGRVLNFRLSWPQLEQNVSNNNHFPAQPVPSVRQGHSPAGRDSHPHTLGLQAMPLAFWRSHTQQALSDLERRSERRIWLQGPAVATTLWLPPAAGAMSLGVRPNGIMQEGGAPRITTRIVRRLKRVEEAPPSSEPRLVAGAASAPSFEEIVETPPRKLNNASPVGRFELGAGGPIPPGINVTQLTDEVIRQIDRRLVGVRERMGKI